MSKASKTVLPTLVVTQVAEDGEPGGTRIALPDGVVYFIKPDAKLNDFDGYHRVMGDPDGRFNLFPVVLNRDKSPWPEANMWLLSRALSCSDIDMGTLDSASRDLSSFLEFLEDKAIDWTKFPEEKLRRPTYRYNGHLKIALLAGEATASAAGRAMSTVTAFYRWLDDEGLFKPDHAPWQSRDRYVEVGRRGGGATFKKVTTTDVAINVPKQVDPYDETIEDGAKLRPLPKEEQEWVLAALVQLGNHEMLLIHLCGFCSGARIGSILTLRVRHVLRDLNGDINDEVRIPAGPGTGIDTKNDKQLVLHFPIWVYRMLHVYASSDASRRRRERAPGGDNPEQYLFLSRQGQPFYQCKAERRVFNPTNKRRYQKNGQPVRQFMRDHVLPTVRKLHPKFHYKFHDTRASFGMNLTDALMDKVARGEISLHQARDHVRTRLGHEDSVTTDKYLNFRTRVKLVRKSNSEYDQHLRLLMSEAEAEPR